MRSKGWIGVDFDGTLSVYEGFKGVGTYGPPVPAMLARVKQWLAEGREVRILTARAWEKGEVEGIRRWCREHVGEALPVTHSKDYDMLELWDDLAVGVEKNTGAVRPYCPRCTCDSI